MANFNSNKKYHIIYKTTNLLSGKYYIGMHSTNNLKDGYMGSGDLIRKSIKKYGKENHKFEILEHCNSRQELANRELEIVTLQEIAKKECMNLKVGGEGGLHNKSHYEKFTQAGIQNLINSKEKREKILIEIRKTTEYRNNVSNGLKEYYKNNDGTFTGRCHSEETKSKMKESSKNKGIGRFNSQFGTCWITNGIINKKINKKDQIPKEWKRGRV